MTKRKPKRERVPKLTKKMIEETLRKSAKGANELLKQLEESHLHASYDLRLD